MRISDWSSDVCSSDLPPAAIGEAAAVPTQHLDIGQKMMSECHRLGVLQMRKARHDGVRVPFRLTEQCSLTSRSEEHTSELQSLMRISYAVFCLKKKTHKRYERGRPEYNTADEEAADIETH